LRQPNTNSIADGNTYTDGNTDSYTHANANSHGHSYTYANSHSHVYAYCYCNGNAYAHANGDSHSYGDGDSHTDSYCIANSHVHTDAAGDSYRKTSADPAAPTVALIGTLKAGTRETNREFAAWGLSPVGHAIPLRAKPSWIPCGRSRPLGTRPICCRCQTNHHSRKYQAAKAALAAVAAAKI
jgi:hypothetical protein